MNTLHGGAEVAGFNRGAEVAGFNRGAEVAGFKLWQWGVVVFLGLSACGPSLDTNRPPNSRSTGAAIYEELCNRVAIAANPHDVSGHLTYATCHDGAPPAAGAVPRLVALHAERDRFIDAVNTTLDPKLGHDFKNFLGELLPLYDNGLMRQQINALADVVGAVAAAPEAVQALGRLSARQGYVPSASQGLVEALLSYGNLDGVTGELLLAIGHDRPGHADWLAWQSALQAQLAHDPKALAVDAKSVLAVSRDYLLRAVPAASAATEAALVLSRDARGMAVPTRLEGQLLPPFVDVDEDGLADIDTHGHFVDANGTPLQVPTPFALHGQPDPVGRDAAGRALRADDTPWYDYRDVAPSVLSGVLQQARRIVRAHPETALSWAPAVHALLGAEQMKVHTYADGTSVAFTGYDATSSPLLDVAQGAAALFDKASLPGFFELSHKLLSEHEVELAGAIQLMWQMHEWLQAPEMKDVALEANATLMDDLLEVAADIARTPGLLTEVMQALHDPASQVLGARFAEQLRTRDYIDFDPNDINGPVLGRFVTPVDRSQPESVINRSVLQRLMHLVHDTSGLKTCNAQPEGMPYARCDLFQIDDAAVFYVKAMLGTAELTLHFSADDSFFPEQFTSPDPDTGAVGMENFTGIKGFAPVDRHDTDPAHVNYFTYNVTPEAAARLLFSTYDSRVDPESAFGQKRLSTQLVFERLYISGMPFDELHHGTLFAWEINGFFDALRPTLKAFAKFNQEKLVVKILDVLHKHWATPQSVTTQSHQPNLANFSYQDGVSRFEPLLARALDEGQALQVLGRVALAVETTPVGQGAVLQSGVTVTEHLLQGLLLPELSPSLRFADGKPFATKNDGTVVGPPAPVHLFKSAMRGMSNRLDEFLPKGSQASDFALNTAHTLLDVEPAAAGGWRLKNREAHALTVSFVDFAAERLDSHRAANDVPAWQESLPLDLRDLLAHPITASSVRLLDAFSQQPGAAVATSGLVDHLLGPSFDATLSAAANGLQALADTENVPALLAPLHQAFTPRTGLAARLVDVLEQARQRDTQHALPRLLQNLVKDTGGETPLAAFGDIFTQVNRAQPGARGGLTVADYNAILPLLHHFMVDPKNGLARLLDVAEQRNTHP